jgi:glucosylceramidase
LIFNIFLVDCKRECIPRSGHDTIYCVCNTTYCDDLDAITKQEKGSVLLFETNKKGDRFKQTKLKFTSNDVSNDSFTLTIDKSKTYQKIIGFGGAFTDANGINLNTLPKDLASNVIKDYFSENGIEYTMGRVPIAGCDFSSHPYSYDDNPNDDNLTLFKLQTEDFDYKV